MIKYNDEEYTLHQLSQLSGIKIRTLQARIYEKGWSIDKAVTIPVIKHGKDSVIVGKKYNYITVLKYIGQDGKHKTLVEGLCDCGNTFTVRLASLKSGTTKSCGKCKLVQPARNRSNYHGLTHTRVYQSWCSMKNRCYNKNQVKYKNYGGRGITVCEEWKNDFQAFYKWAVDNGYREDLTIDRIDVDGDYTPENCRWVTLQKQAQNKTNTVKIKYKGDLYTLRELSNVLGISYQAIVGRYYRGTLHKYLED